ncbi:hypothetical protein CAP35_09365 [Chitinophagaceae bacterium IBVUCB1]|nr:hypothetical protein CAP35_09365 [Chitinophagaceae bacterium IBVUCB1]
MPTNKFPGFEYTAEELSAYKYHVDVFVILLKIGKIITHKTTEVNEFATWLDAHGIRKID